MGAMTLNLTTITVDCRDALEVAGFWSAALDRPLDDGATADFASVGGAPAMAFVRVPEGKQVKNRVHVDLQAPDREKEVKRLLKLGATRVADIDEDGQQWTTLADVEGNEFCVA